MHSVSRIMALLLLTAAPSLAQMPVLKVTEKVAAQTVTLQSMKIDVQVTGNIATTVMTMRFYNHSDRQLEGELSFPLPEGVTVSRYALDINGHMREAVPVEKHKATETFESIEQRRVDPGLLEKTEGNNFRTRIYPLPPRGTRTILIGYEEELKGARYHLPLDFKQAIPSFQLKATVWESLEKPVLEEGPGGEFQFRNTSGHNHVAEISKTDYRPGNALTVRLPKTASMPEALLQKAGGSYYFLVNAYPQAQTRPRAMGNRIGLIWDVSLSGLKRDLKKEMALLDLLIHKKQNLTIELGLLNNRFTKAGTFSISNGDWRALKKVLENVVYDGGTNLSAARPFAVDEYLFFSDGLSSFGAPDVRLFKPVHCITTAPRADYSNLKWIAAQSGGRFINLQALAAENAVTLLEQEVLQFLGIKQHSAVREVYPSVPFPANGSISLAGITDDGQATITLQFGFKPGAVAMEQTVQLKPGAANMVDVHRIWAQKKIAEMDVRYEQHKEEISLLSKQFGIVTRNTSLIVLEAVEDYVRYDIAPPAELRGEYDRIKKQQWLEKETKVNGLLQAAITMTADLKTWWNQAFKPEKRKGYPVPDSVSANGSGYVSASAHMRMAAPAAAVKDEDVREVAAVDRQAPAAQSAIYGSRAADMKASETLTAKNKADKARVAIETAEYKSDQAYMQAMKGAAPAAAYRYYLQQRETYITTPLFYFDMASWFYQQHQRDTALTILSSIAELDQENAELYKMMAYKLKEYKQFEEEIFVTRKILEWRPMDPQSYRDYALALEDGCYYQQALDTLYSTLLQSYTRETAQRDAGIEEIIITEINHLITRHKRRLNLAKIDQRLIFSMPVEVRVVINWNKKNTDIDLWVTDPSGEKCFYSNPRSMAGGRISNDFTNGYGPEQFMLKKALKGKYTIETNFFGETQVSITGSTTLMAEIYTRYGDGNENRKVITMQMPKADKDGVFIGTFSF